jgi:hypothetical protein
MKLALIIGMVITPNSKIENVIFNARVKRSEIFTSPIEEQLLYQLEMKQYYEN